MKDYCVVSGGEVYELEEAVREKVKEGYKPQGGVSVKDTEGETVFYQAMYKDTIG